MKTYNITIAITAFMLLFVSNLLAQSQIAVPLSKPGQPGTLEMSFIMADVHIKAHTGNEVIIRYEGDNMRDDSKERDANRDGLRRIGGGGSGFEVSENNNKVTIDGGIPRGEIEFEILVPRNFSLQISVVNGDDITIDGVNGNHEINHVNGDITLINVMGSAMVNTVNGDITATFDSVSPDKPMAFSNVNGDIDLTLPANAKFTAKMRSEFGEMFTDFDMSIKKNEGPNVSRNSGLFKVEVNNWVIGDVNGGGPEYLLKTLRGDFFIRKK